METNAKLLSDHIVSSNRAMEVLFKKKHHESALILLYSWVDRLAWLSVDAEESNGGDFRQWLNRYLFVEEEAFPFNADDLWGARCALLHTGTSEARDVKKGKARAVFYYGGQIDVVAKNTNEQVYVNVGQLHVSLIGASLRFLQHLEKTPNELRRVNLKIGKILQRTTDF